MLASEAPVPVKVSTIIFVPEAPAKNSVVINNLDFELVGRSDTA